MSVIIDLLVKNTAIQYGALMLNLIEEDVLTTYKHAITGTDVFLGTAHKD